MTAAQLVEELDKMGFISPDVKKLVESYFDKETELRRLHKENTEASSSREEAAAKVKSMEEQVADLGKKLKGADHPDAVALDALKNAVADTSVSLDDQVAQAQKFLWAFPTSSLLPEGQKIMDMLQGKVTERDQKIADDKRKIAERLAYLTDGAMKHNLRLEEWREFLKDKTQDEVAAAMGNPDSAVSDGNWYYLGPCTLDPASQERAGLVIIFNGTRVQNVSVKKITSPQ